MHHLVVRDGKTMVLGTESHLLPSLHYSYMILATKEMSKEKEDKQAAAVCFEKIQLEEEKFRLGHTKVTNLPLTDCLADSCRNVLQKSASFLQNSHAQLKCCLHPFREQFYRIRNTHMCILKCVHMCIMFRNLTY